MQVYNVSLSLLQRSFPDQPPFRVVELRTERREGGEVERRQERESDRRAEPQPGRRATDQPAEVPSESSGRGPLICQPELGHAVIPSEARDLAVRADPSLRSG